MSDVFKESLKNGAELVGITLTPDVIDNLFKFNNLVMEWNQKFNLTSITEDGESAEKHFIDSLLLTKVIEDQKINNSGIRVCDVGAGAGFPGIPVKLANPTIDLTLLDSLNKRIGFLQFVIDEFKLQNAEAIHARVEDFGHTKSRRESYDVVTSRAVARLNVLAEFCLPLVRVGGKFLAMKGPDAGNEVMEAEKAIITLGGQIASVEKFVLPFSQDERNIIVIQKVKTTPKNYPRKAGLPAKKPL